MKKIAYLSGTRADFGLMTSVLQAIEHNQDFKLHLYYTGMHLLPQFGHSATEVLKFFPQAQKINASFKDDSAVSSLSFFADLVARLSQQLIKDKIDYLLILGDRVEMLAAAVCCLHLGIPTLHLHSGERSSTVDEPSRHAISRLASLLLPATKKSAQRLLRNGEEAWRIKVVGAPALDNILQAPLPSRAEIYQFLGLPLEQKFLLLLQHPVSQEVALASRQMRISLRAVSQFNLPVVLIYPNADPGSQEMIAEILKIKKNKLFKVYQNLPHQTFLALEKYAACFLGNSSSGLIETPSFKTPVLDIGTRQANRERAINVLHCEHKVKDIVAGINTCLFDPKFKNKLSKLKNPWGDGKCAQRVVRILSKNWDKNKLLRKKMSY